MHFVYTVQDLVALGLLILFGGGFILLILLSLFIEFVSSLWEKRWWK